MVVGFAGPGHPGQRDQPWGDPDTRTGGFIRFSRVADLMNMHRPAYHANERLQDDTHHEPA
jgi:hypothetical protein